jgi:hypothetical protein
MQIPIFKFENWKSLTVLIVCLASLKMYKVGDKANKSGQTILAIGVC